MILHVHTHLQVQEAMLTGESVPVSKKTEPAAPEAPLGDRKCMCYSATAVTSGQAMGVVVGTGDSAEIGQINRMVNTVSSDGQQPATPPTFKCFTLTSVALQS